MSTIVSSVRRVLIAALCGAAIAGLATCGGSDDGGGSGAEGGGAERDGVTPQVGVVGALGGLAALLLAEGGGDDGGGGGDGGNRSPDLPMGTSPAPEQEPSSASGSGLGIRSIQVSDFLPQAGETIALRPTLSNHQNVARSDSLRMCLHQLSSSTSLPTEDNRLRCGEVQFDADGVTDLLHLVTLPAGDHYFTACIANKLNNCHTRRVTVSEVATDNQQDTGSPFPNLEVSEFLVTKPKVRANEHFQLLATVLNQQTAGRSSSTTLRYYVRENNSREDWDEVGTDPVISLDPGATDEVYVPMIPEWSSNDPLEPGAYYYRACVDPADGEDDTENYCSDPSPVEVMSSDPSPPPGSPPDLDIGQITVIAPQLSSSASIKLESGSSVTLRVTINKSGGVSEKTQLRWRQSDGILAEEFVYVGQPDTVRPFAAGQDSIELETTIDGLTEGIYYYSACVVTVTGDSDPSNDCTNRLETVRIEATLNHRATGTVSIDGTMMVGETLRAEVSNVADENGLTNRRDRFQWEREYWFTWIPIKDANKETYTILPADRGSTIRVTVSFTDDHGYSESLASRYDTSTPSTYDTSTQVQPRITSNPISNPPHLATTWSEISDSDIPIGQSTTVRIWVHNSGAMSEPTALQYFAIDLNAFREYRRWESEYLGEMKVPSLDTGETSDEIVRTFTFSKRGLYGIQACVDWVANEILSRENRPRNKCIGEEVSVGYNTQPTGNVTVEGDAVLNQTLRAVTMGIDDPKNGLTPPTTFTYQWERGDSATDTTTQIIVKGEDMNEYTLKRDDLGHHIRVTVFFNDDDGYPEMLTSTYVGPVRQR